MEDKSLVLFFSFVHCSFDHFKYENKQVHVRVSTHMNCIKVEKKNIQSITKSNISWDVVDFGNALTVRHLKLNYILGLNASCWRVIPYYLSKQ